MAPPSAVMPVPLTRMSAEFPSDTTVTTFVLEVAWTRLPIFALMSAVSAAAVTVVLVSYTALAVTPAMVA
jgi:hypothetical protein